MYSSVTHYVLSTATTIVLQTTTSFAETWPSSSVRPLRIITLPIRRQMGSIRTGRFGTQIICSTKVSIGSSRRQSSRNWLAMPCGFVVPPVYDQRRSKLPAKGVRARDLSRGQYWGLRWKQCVAPLRARPHGANRRFAPDGPLGGWNREPLNSTSSTRVSVYGRWRGARSNTSSADKSPTLNAAHPLLASASAPPYVGPVMEQVDERGDDQCEEPDIEDV
jgi:hypothetical protein